MDEHQYTQNYHVIVRFVVVVHQVQGHGNVGVTIITAEIVLKNQMDSTFMI